MFKNKNENTGKLISFKGKKYAFNYEKIKEFCLTSSKDGGSKEVEISQVYEAGDGGDLTLSSKVEHETKTVGNIQNDMIMYDVLKLLIVTLLEDSQPINGYMETFSTTLAINTLLSWGILEELK